MKIGNRTKVRHAISHRLIEQGQVVHATEVSRVTFGFYDDKQELNQYTASIAKNAPLIFLEADPNVNRIKISLLTGQFSWVEPGFCHVEFLTEALPSGVLFIEDEFLYVGNASVVNQ